jgi:thymidine kinase
MAKLYFYYSAMNAGKTTTLLQSSHNYAERGMSTLLLKPQIDDREGTTRITSRIGLEGDAYCFSATEDLYRFVGQHHESETVHCLLVDEGQFLTAPQVEQLGDVVDRLGIPVLVYGIRTDFQGELFAGSSKLLALADELREIKTICHCGSKATMVARLGTDGRPMRTGAQIQVGGNETYVSMCRKHWKAALKEDFGG